MRRAAIGALAIALAACGGAQQAKSGKASGADLSARYLDAFRTEATGDPARARQLYLETIAAAASAPNDPWQLAAVQAALDALVHRHVSGLDDVASRTALAFRSAGDIAGPLAREQARADDPFTPGLVARSLTTLAAHAGDAKAAETWRASSGCVREATVVGPLVWAPVSGVSDPDPLESFDAKLAPSYSAPGPFAPKVVPIVVTGRGCRIDPGLASVIPGVRDVVIDVVVDAAQRIGVAIRAHGEASLRVGGRPVLRRPYELGDDGAARFARVDVGKGVVRIVARVGMTDDGEPIEVSVWDAHGKPLKAHAPRPGDQATARATAHEEVSAPAPKSDPERLLFGGAALAAEDGRTAERLLAPEVRRKDAPPEILLMYARAVETAADLPHVHRAERARGAYERVIEAWPTSWEAIVAHASLAAVRRGQSEARIEALRDLDGHRAKAGKTAAPMLDAFDAAASGRDALRDRAQQAYERAKAALGGAAIVAEIERSAFERTGAERVAFECDRKRPLDRSGFGCFDAHRSAGDTKGSRAELATLRALYGAPSAFLAVELRDALATGDVAVSTRAVAAMLPAERTLSFLHATSGEARPTAAALRELFAKTTLDARDAPYALGPLLRVAADDPVAAMDKLAEQIVAADRQTTILPNAATAVLAHTERYDVDPSGIVHALMLDVRRVSGTKDVEDNAQASPPDVSGRSTLRVLRRRILKRDGRIVEPDRTPRAAQGHADLSQLEAGDAVEAIYETWALPGETGDITIDTPDLLPERTAVHDATIELRVPKGLRNALWSHPILGKAQETLQGGQRILTWRVKDHPGRRLELGTPKMDQNASVSFSTAVWSDVGRALRETVAALDEHAPEVGDWAREAAKGKAAGSIELVRAVVEASGTAVKESSSALLADVGLGRARGPQTTTARTILSNHEGSRTWLVARALRELGVDVEITVAEDEPYSADPAFPPHFGRFMHPLAVAHLGTKGGGATADVWIDADVAGPPLPAGRISPDLRGRSMLKSDGTIVPVPALSNDGERDEVDLRLVLDEKGDAKGSFTIMLRGREAQELAEALFRIVGAERQRALRGVVLAWVPYANVDDVALSSSEGSWQIAIRATISVAGYAQSEGGEATKDKTWWLPGIDPLHIVYPRPFVSTLGATYAHQGARETALAINQSAQYHAHRRVELPKGSSVVRSPSAFAVKGADLVATRAISVGPAAIEDDFVLDLPTGTVTPAEYGAFVKSVHRTDDAFLASTRVRLGP